MGKVGRTAGDAAGAAIKLTNTWPSTPGKELFSQPLHGKQQPPQTRKGNGMRIRRNYQGLNYKK